MKKVILSADSTCDLGPVLKERYNVEFFPFAITLDDKTYLDNVDITADAIYDAFRDHGSLPKTSAINVMEYVDYFKKFVDEGYEVVHINLGSGLSSTHNNCRMAAAEVGNVYPVDSCNLSTGIGLLVIEAAERIAKGMEAKQVAEEVQALTSNVHTNFVLDTLDYLKAGGRCSALAVLGANILGIKPCIEVDNTCGKMGVGKKYRGKYEKVLEQYATERLGLYDNIKSDRVFITHSGISEERIKIIKDIVEASGKFDEIFVTRASCTISSHCGPNTIGILFMTK